MAYASARPVEVIGHRGSPREYRENTLSSFARAFELGANAVELDVHSTRDGVLVVHHDPITNSRPGDTGPAVRIADTTATDLQRVPVAGERIPTLADVLASVPDSGIVYIEVKAAAIEREVVAAIRAGGRRCAVHSFDHRIARHVAELAPDLPCGILQTSYPVDPVRAMRDAGARDLWQQWELIDQALVDLVHGDGRRLVAWTANDAHVAERLIGWGADGICTDVPAIMRDLVDAHAAR